MYSESKCASLYILISYSKVEEITSHRVIHITGVKLISIHWLNTNKTNKEGTGRGKTIYSVQY